MSSVKNIIAGLLIGAGVGYFSGKINQPQYTLQESDNSTYLFSKNSNKSYEIFDIKDNFYLGDFEHNLNGIKDVAYYRGLSINEDDLLVERHRSDSLDDVINNQSRKIKRRQFFDKIDETKEKVDIAKYKIKLWYQDLKRRQLD